jgi:hypothetical protein
MLPAAVVALLFAESPGRAGPILDFTGGIQAFVAIDGTFGWKFRVESPVSIEGLGIFDVGADGLADGHAIGLWTGDGVLLRAAAITNADSTPVASASSDGDWRLTRPFPR